jgi:hypothetical protein
MQVADWWHRFFFGWVVAHDEEKNVFRRNLYLIRLVGKTADITGIFCTQFILKLYIL